MNPAGDDLTLSIDRLVDGECTEVDRRALLLLLESEPDGWRRCALAFLEDQALRSALSDSMTSRSAAPLATIPAVPKSHPMTRRLALVASLFLVAFTVGFNLGGSSRHRGDVPAAESRPIASVKDNAVSNDVIRAVGWATVEGDGNAVRRVPILAGPGLDEDWLRTQPSAVPEYVRAQWERSGYQVAERRQLISINLEDGRRLAIPMEGVEMQYVGQSTY